MNKRRLLKLADLLEADAKNRQGIKFDLDIVGGASDWMTDQYTPGVDCGTTACAMGLAAVSGAFKRAAGLSYKVHGFDLRPTVNGRDIDYISAAIKVFSISEYEAHFLFTPASYVCAQEGAKGERFVAKRIRDFVAGKVSP